MMTAAMALREGFKSEYCPYAAAAAPAIANLRPAASCTRPFGGEAYLGNDVHPLSSHIWNKAITYPKAWTTKTRCCPQQQANCTYHKSRLCDHIPE